MAACRVSWGGECFRLAGKGLVEDLEAQVRPFSLAKGAMQPDGALGVPVLEFDQMAFKGYFHSMSLILCACQGNHDCSKEKWPPTPHCPIA